MIFGSRRDVAVLTHISREVVSAVVEQEVLYWKVDLTTTVDNLYGEAEQKNYYQPVRMTCRIERNPQDWSEQDYGLDLTRKVIFDFHKADFESIGYKAEPGDIIEWDKDYYEIDSTQENQLFLGKDQHYRLDNDRTETFGNSVSILCNAHLTRYKRFNIVPRN